jgi:hypothetical protein
MGGSSAMVPALAVSRRRIIAIALEAGLGDLSTFNKTTWRSSPCI